jgi:triacylglycerol lipase
MLPVVLHHGMFGSGDIQLGPVKLSYFRGIDRAIAARGHALIITRVHPSSSVANRARQLKESILRQQHILGQPQQKVILIAHSMGGLDARYAVAKLGLAEHVAAVVTVSCPHRGSPFADWIVKNLGQRLRGIQLVKFLGLDLRAIDDVTTGRCAEFNQEVPDVAGVRYFSIGAARDRSDIAPFALFSHRIIFDAEGDNDGLVSVKSSAWGEHLGVWPADHWQTINRRYRFELRSPAENIIKCWMEMLDHVTAATSSDNCSRMK